MEGNHYDELLVELECPVCSNYMTPPIRQCATGHSICENCRHRLPKCPLCQGKFTDSRNISLEGLAIKMRYPCSNKNLGCNEKLSYTEREIHEMKCPLKGFKCAMEKCPWVGKLEELPAHWASKAMSSKPYNKNNVCHTKVKGDSYYVNIINAHNQLFWFKCKLIKNQLFWAVQFIGNPSEAENYYYHIEIFKPGKNHKKILLSDYCQGVDLENSQLFTADGCLSIDVANVNSFVSAEQILIYYMRVYVVKDDPEKPQAQVAAVKQDKPQQGAPGVKKNKQQHQQQGKGKGPKGQGQKNPKPNDPFVLI